MGEGQRKLWKDQGYDPDIQEEKLLGFLRILSASFGILQFEDLGGLTAGNTFSSSYLEALVRSAPRIIIGSSKEGFSLCHPRLTIIFMMRWTIPKKV